VERLDDVFSAQPEESPKTLVVLLRGDVRFENVTFRYNDEEAQHAQNISLRYAQGKPLLS